jgi:hypothetical protein
MVAENHPVREVLQKIVVDKSISADQVLELEKFVGEDWVIDENEAEFLFRVNQALGSNHNDCEPWTQFFVSSISRFVVMDMNTPGEIDPLEGDWLAKMLDEFSVGNQTEQKMLLELQKCSSSIAGKLGETIQPIQ